MRRFRAAGAAILASPASGARSAGTEGLAARAPLVDGKTRLYGTIGDPIEHVASPTFMTEAFRAAAINALVVPIHARPSEFDIVMRGLQAIGNFDGLVVTLP